MKLFIINFLSVKTGKNLVSGMKSYAGKCEPEFYLIPNDFKYLNQMIEINGLTINLNVSENLEKSCLLVMDGMVQEEDDCYDPEHAGILVKYKVESDEIIDAIIDGVITCNYQM